MAEELRVCADSVDQNREMFAGQEINLPKRCTAANIDMTQAAKAAYKHKVRMWVNVSREWNVGYIFFVLKAKQEMFQ